MEKVISLFLSVVTLICSIACIDLSAFADVIVEGDFKIEVLSETDKTCKLVEYSGQSEILEIPNTVNGYMLESIDNLNNTYIKTLKVPSSVKQMSTRYATTQDWQYNSALTGAINLKTVIFEDGTKSISAGALSKCTQVETIIIPNSVETIGEKSFYNCISATNINIPSSVTSIGNYAFNNCYSFTLALPENLSIIGEGAFSGCTQINKIILPQGLNTIGQSAFSGTKITEISIPSSVKQMSTRYATTQDWQYNSALIGAINLKTVIFENGTKSISAGALSKCTQVETIIIPDSVETIGEKSFYNCISATNINIPSSVTSIGNYAFNNCYSFTLTLPENLSIIGEGAFSGCTQINKIILPQGLNTIGQSAFSGTKITEISIPSSVKQMSTRYSTAFGFNYNSAFIGMQNLKTVIFEKGTTNISIGALSKCSQLFNVVIPKTVTRINEKAFFNCNSLKDVYYAGSEDDWDNVQINNDNDCLENATIHYNSEFSPTYVENQIAFEKSIYLMNIGYSQKLNVNTRDAYISNGDIIYKNVKTVDNSSLNWSTNIGEEDKVIKFSQDGTVEALSEGLAYLSVTSKNDINKSANCWIYVGKPNALNFTTTYDAKQYYADGGFFSQTSSMSDCVEFYCLFENKLVDELQILEDKLSLSDLADISPITLTASVSGKDLSFSRSDYQNTYTTTLSSIAAGKAVDDILMLFPYNLSVSPSGNKYTVTVTLESDSFETVTEKYSFTIENIENKSANEHIEFISNNCDYIKSKNNQYGKSMVTLKDDAEYKWSKYSSFDFKNYYEIVLADILIEVLNVNQVEMPSKVPSVLKEWVGTYKTLLGGITTIVNDDYTGKLDISETKIDKLLKKSKYTTEGIYTNDELYQTVLDLLGNADNAGKITKVFSAIDKTQQAVGFVKLGKNIIKDALEWGNRITLLNEYANANTEFKEVMKKFADSIPENQKKMKEAVYDYINYSADMSGQMNELLESFSEMLGSVTLDVFKSCIGKSLFNYLGIQVFNWIGSITLASGVALSATPAFAGVQTAFGSFFTGATLGLCLSDVLCDSSGKSQEMSKVVAMSEFSPYIIDALNYCESDLYKQRNNKAVDKLEYSFTLHKATQSYIMNHTVKSLEIKRDSLIIKIFGRDDYDGLISDILAQKAVIDNLKCHSSGEAGETLSVKTKVIAVKCPVNVFFYDNAGKEIVRIINGVEEYVAEGISVLIDGDKKYIALPATQSYSTKIVATDEGTMEYLVTEYDEGAQRLRSVNKTNISLVPDKTFTGEISEEMTSQPEEYALTNDEELILPDKVIDNPITGVELNYKNLDLTIGEKSKLIATVTPVNVTNAKVRWISDDPSIANVDDNGNITTFSTGTTTIYVITEDWGYVDSCIVSVSCIHSYDSGKLTKNPTCTSTGVKTYTCTVCGEEYTETIAELEHTIVIDKAKAATCTSTGLTEGSHCSECKMVITKQNVVTKKAHSYKTTTTKATTSKNGSTMTKCTACGNVSKNTTIYYPKTITLSKTSYTYDGKVKKPSVTVKDSKDNKIAASNYTVTYTSGRKNVGSYTVTIKFKGSKYSGTVKKTFTIKPKATTLSSVKAKSKGFTVKWKKLTTQTTGYQIQYSTDKNFKKNNKTVTVSKNSTTSKTISKLSAKKKYYVRIRTYKTVKVNGKSTKIYSSWSKAKTVTTKK